MQKVIQQLKKTKWLLIALVLAGLLFAWQKGYFSTSSKTSTLQQTVTAKVERGNVVSSISASGQVATANYLSVTTSVNGIVKQVFVKEGDKVSAGQKLMDITLDSEGERSRISSYAAYLRAQNSLRSAKNNSLSLETSVAKAKQAFQDEKEKNSYQSDQEKIAYQIAETDYKNAQFSQDKQKSELAALQLAVNNAWLDYQAQSPTIVSPSDGVIASVLAVEGSKIENSVSERSIQTVAAIKKEGTPIASLNVGEIDINNVQVGQKVNLTLNSISDKKLTGKIVGIDRVGTSTSGVTNYPVMVKFDEPSTKVLPNMTVQSEIIMEEKENVLYVPTSAIRKANGKTTVRVKRNGTQENIEVQTGVTGTANTEIISGLNEGDEIIINTLPTSGFTTSQTTPSRTGNTGFGVGNFIRR